jgi:hypothetical protein
MVAARLARQAIFDRATPPNVSVILDKSVLHRLIGSPQVMYDALMHVVEPEVAQVLQVERRWRARVEAGDLSGKVLVRDTTNRDGGTLVFTTDAWTAFTASLK